MITINIATPVEGRVVFTRRGTGAGDQYATTIPGTVEVSELSGDDFYQVTIRTGTGTAWAETYAVRPGPGEHDLEDLDRLSLGEAVAGGFALAGRLSALEGRVGEAEDTLGGEIFNRLAAHEEALWLTESTFEAHVLGPVTWLTASSGRIQIPGYVPQPVARSYRVELDILTEDHASTGDLWIRVMNGDTQLLHLNFAAQVNRAGDTNRYRFQLDFNAPANAALEIAHNAALRNPTAGRAGYTRPVLSTPIVRSA